MVEKYAEKIEREKLEEAMSKEGEVKKRKEREERKEARKKQEMKWNRPVTNTERTWDWRICQMFQMSTLQKKEGESLENAIAKKARRVEKEANKRKIEEKEEARKKEEARAAEVKRREAEETARAREAIRKNIKDKEATRKKEFEEKDFCKRMMNNERALDESYLRVQRFKEELERTRRQHMRSRI